VSHIVLEHLVKEFKGGVRGVDDVSLEIAKGEILILVGPSGCGKTTTLRMIAGLEDPTSGRILFSGKDVTHLPPEKRNVGFVFQNYALFPNMTVAQNVAFGLTIRKAPPDLIKKKVDSLLGFMGISNLANRRPNELSGGQQQRVAFARALAIEPEILLLDEPLSALDAKLRDNLRVELARLLDELKLTTVYVTHDQSEAMGLGHRIAVMNQGRVVQCDTPRQIYQNPANAFVASFIGRTNLLRGKVAGEPGSLRVDLGFTQVGLTADPGAREVTVIIRPEDLVLVQPGESPDMEILVTEALFYGQTVRVVGRADDETEIVADLENSATVKRGDRVGLRIRPGKMLVKAMADAPGRN